MSRTDKTKPLRVKALHADLCFREAHNHARGTCDLPALSARDPFGAPGGCRRVFHHTGTNPCCCALCSGFERRSKKSRRESKKQCRDARNAAALDLEHVLM